MSSSEKSINAFEEILKWSQGLPDWQSDALRRIIQQQEVSSKDIKEISTFLKAQHGLIRTEELTVKPKRLSEKDIPLQSAGGIRIILKGMRNLKNVNAIAPGQELGFNNTGMTIVYGKNASGKSGYARVLKKACRARGEEGPILPDVFADPVPENPAEADIDINDGQNDISIKWTDGGDTADVLASIMVFDARCARVYVDEANEVAYIPYGLDVFNKLAKVCESLKSAIQAEIDSIGRNIYTGQTLIGDLQGNTAVGTFVRTITAGSPVARVEGLVNLSADEKARLSDIEKKLTEIKVNDPTQKANALRTKKRKLERLITNLNALSTTLSHEVVKKVKKLQTDLDTAAEANKIASQRSFEHEALKGVGSDIWKTLFQAAKEYSEGHAYPGVSFPFTGKDARCVLCFQPLLPEAADRMKKFYEFIQDKTASTYREAKNKYDTEAFKITSAQTDILRSEPELIKEIAEVNETVAVVVSTYLEDMKRIHEDIKKSILTKKWTEISFPAPPIDELTNAINTLEENAKAFEKMANPEEKARLTQEYEELVARQKLSNKKAVVLTLIEDLKKKSNLDEGIRATTTTGISRKNTELMELLITEALKQNLKKEFQYLNVDYIKIDLDNIGRQGVALHKLKLQTKVSGAITLSDILSEGEQRAIAIASFMAELKTSPHSCGIVFDDPVSSLDHARRELVARRLAEEAKKRQVIIFTHDLVFLVGLRHACERQDISYKIQTVWARGTRGTGLCDSNAPWAGQKVSSRISYLKGHALVQIKKLAGAPTDREEYERRVNDFMEKLRETWERAIEEVVFCDAVQRYRDSVETHRLKGVKFDDGDYSLIDEAMTRCSKYQHDEAAAKNERSLPEPDALETELKCLEDFVAATHKRNETVAKSR
ncbi:MAG: AAA family ATPase [Candidatus Omnitrophota bacterium]